MLVCTKTVSKIKLTEMMFHQTVHRKNVTTSKALLLCVVGDLHLVLPSMRLHVPAHNICVCVYMSLHALCTHPYVSLSVSE